MQLVKLALITAAVAAISIGAAVNGATDATTVARIDFEKTVRLTTPAYDARLAPAAPAHIKEFRIPIKDATIQIADSVGYRGWTFGGTVPGPVIRVRQEDSVRITVVNEAAMPHSIDFHAARIPPNIAYRIIMPHDSVQFAFVARDAGAFLVHCGTPPVLMHLMQGMYFTMIVDPKHGWPTRADKEFVLVQSEFYAHADSTGRNAEPDFAEARKKDPTYVVFNGRAFQYKANPLEVNVGDRVRFFVVNAGPNVDSDFHIVGAIFDRVYPDCDPAHALRSVQTYLVPAGGGVVFETTFKANESGEGIYAFVTHSFADADKGAVGMIRVGVPTHFATMAH